VSDNQLPFNKWSALLEPTPQELRRKVTEPVAEVTFAPVEQHRPEVETTVLTVSHLNQLIKAQIEGEFKSVWLQGEISNFKAHTSGHYYFSLKDDKSQINAVMFKGFNGKLKFRPDSGMEVIVRGRVTVYEPRGNYQIFCESMEPVGAGALQRAYEQLKNKLQNEGLFSSERKQKLPLLPKHIGVVTSPTGAAIQDILNVLSRRYRGGKITVIPARVQGDGAAEEVVRGIQLANRVGGFDVLIVGRGGGSIEDLWCFNEESVARAIFSSQIPIISAVGHEIDFTIADFVADVRAPTPSAAAEIVAKSASELAEKITNLQRTLMQRMQFSLSQWLSKIQHLQSQLVDPKRRLQDLAIRADELQQRLILAWQRQSRDLRMQVRHSRERLKSPKSVIDDRRKTVSNHAKELQKEIAQQIRQREQKLQTMMSMLDSLSPLQVVRRGYALVFDQEVIVKKAAQVQLKQELIVQLSEGALRVQVLGTEKSKIKETEEESWTSKKS
jgi:exodeoxyribonuclease VII large subunit